MALYGVGLNTNVERINTEFHLFLSKQKGLLNIRDLIKKFQHLDSNNSQRLSLEQFQKGLNNFGFFLKHVDYQCLLKFYDHYNDGHINYNEFISGIKQKISERRLILVDQLFNSVDVQQTGSICPKELGDKLNITKHKDYVQEKKSRDQLVYEYLSCFNLNEQGKITREEFISFYEDLGLGIASDSYFISMLQQNWGEFEDQEQEISQEQLKGIVKILRYRLIQMTTGTNDEFLLRKWFKEFDQNKSGLLTVEDLQAMLIKLEIPIQKKYLNALFQKFDMNKSGFIEFEEFNVYIVNDLYP